MAKILAQSQIFIEQQEVKNQQNEQKAKKMQETSAALQKAAVPAFSSDSDEKNTTEACDGETVAVNATRRQSGDQNGTDGQNNTTNSNCSTRN